MTSSSAEAKRRNMFGAAFEKADKTNKIDNVVENIPKENPEEKIPAEEIMAEPVIETVPEQETERKEKKLKAVKTEPARQRKISSADEDGMDVSAKLDMLAGNTDKGSPKTFYITHANNECVDYFYQKLNKNAIMSGKKKKVSYSDIINTLLEDAISRNREWQEYLKGKK